ncbi:MAG: hypothetical protein KAI57_02770 [Candidatus Pacebacteria bacterium]|nr:hypothetical protein [Candidatus Paceibacterota bacterium]
MTKYSEKLINRLITYIHNNYFIKIDKEQAEIYLDSLADFYSVASKKIETE